MIALSSRDPGLYLAVDGEMQADAAILKPLVKKKSSSLHRAARARKCVNFLSGRNAANICYELLARTGCAQAI